MLGPLDAEARETLSRMLRAELEQKGLTLVERDPRGSVRAWARDVANDPRCVLGILLDAKGSGGWRLVAVDAQRGRAISRELAAGIEHNPANLEAVVSIVLSATNALLEGLEVASTPIDAVVAPESPVAPDAAAPPPKTSEPAPALAEPSAPATRLHAGISAVAASFADAAEPTFGASLDVGATILESIGVDASVARLAAREVTSELGSFSLSRTSIALSAGPMFHAGPLSFGPAAGGTLEWIHRTDTQANPGVAARGERELVRVGGLLETRVRYTPFGADDSELVAIGALLGAAFYGNRVRFRAGDETLGEARRAAFRAELGLFIVTGEL